MQSDVGIATLKCSTATENRLKKSTNFRSTTDFGNPNALAYTKKYFSSTSALKK